MNQTCAPSNRKNVKIREHNNKRAVEIDGSNMAHKIRFETFYSKELLELIISIKGTDSLKDEIERAENPNYVKNNLLNLINCFTNIDEKTIVDFGSGSGASSVILAREGARVIGTEPNNDSIKIAKLRAKESGVGNKVEFIRNVSKLPFKNNFFDVVICNAVIEHIHPKDRKAHLKELWRVIKSEGYLFISETPNRVWPKDFHTTGLWFVPYLPLSLARKYAILSKRISSSESIDDLIKKGIRGPTYWEIVNSLKGEDVIELNKYTNDVDEYFKLDSLKKQSRRKKILQITLKYFYKAADSLICKPLKIPVCGLLPTLRICLKKR